MTVAVRREVWVDSEDRVEEDWEVPVPEGWEDLEDPALPAGQGQEGEPLVTAV